VKLGLDSRQRTEETYACSFGEEELRGQGGGREKFGKPQSTSKKDCSSSRAHPESPDRGRREEKKENCSWGRVFLDRIQYHPISVGGAIFVNAGLKGRIPRVADRKNGTDVGEEGGEGNSYQAQRKFVGRSVSRRGP